MGYNAVVFDDGGSLAEPTHEIETLEGLADLV